MPILALFHRALQLQSRSRNVAILRGLLLGITCIFVLSVQGLALRRAAPGLTLFTELVFLAAAVIVLMGVTLFVNTIAEEKIGNNIELLRMTELSPVAIVLGKSGSQLVRVGLLLLSVLPFMMLSLTLGGVRIHQIIGASLCLFALLLLVANIATFFSVFLAQRGALAMSFLLLAGIQCLPEPLSPLRELIAIVDPRYTGQYNWLLYQSCVAFSVLLFLLAARKFGSSKPTREEGVRPIPRRGWLSPGRVKRRCTLWKDFHFQTGGWPGLLVRSALALAAIAMVGPDDAVMAFIVLEGILVIELAVHASTHWGCEIRDNMFDQLSLTEHRWRRINIQKCKARMLAIVPWIILGAVLYSRIEVRMDIVPAMAIGIFAAFHVGYWACYLSLKLPWGAWAVALIAAPAPFLLVALVAVPLGYMAGCFVTLLFFVMMVGIPPKLQKAIAAEIGATVPVYSVRIPLDDADDL